MYSIDIESFLTKNKMTAKELASFVGRSYQVVSSWRNGTKVPQKYIQKILEAGTFDTSMIIDTSEAVYIDRDVLATLKHQSETILTQSEAILSQQRTIERLIDKGGTALQDGHVGCADAG